MRAMLEKSYCDWYHHDDGMLVLKARLMPDDGARLIAALAAARKQFVNDQKGLPHRPRDMCGAHTELQRTDATAESACCHQASALPLSAQRVMALAAVAASAASGEYTRSIPERVVHVRAATSSSTQERASAEAPAFIEGAGAIPVTTARRMACNARVIVMLADKAGKTRSVGRRTRTVPTAIDRALQYRDIACRFPGCTNHSALDNHHIKHWASGGDTALHNLVRVCEYHHTLLHEGGYSMRRINDNDFVFYPPQGRRIESAAPIIHTHHDALVIDNIRHGVLASAETGASQ